MQLWVTYIAYVWSNKKRFSRWYSHANEMQRLWFRVIFKKIYNISACPILILISHTVSSTKHGKLENCENANKLWKCHCGKTPNWILIICINYALNSPLVGYSMLFSMIFSPNSVNEFYIVCKTNIRTRATQCCHSYKPMSDFGILANHTIFHLNIFIDCNHKNYIKLWLLRDNKIANCAYNWQWKKVCVFAICFAVATCDSRAQIFSLYSNEKICKDFLFIGRNMYAIQ